jgi:hypothetical protein
VTESPHRADQAMTETERVPVDALRGGDVILVPRYGGDQPGQPTYYAYRVVRFDPIQYDGRREVRLALTDVDQPDDSPPTRTLTVRPDTTVLRKKTEKE